MQDFSYLRADTPEQALGLLDSGASLLAGGTDLVPLMKEGILLPRRVVDISHWSGGRAISESGDGLEIGALASLEEIARHERVNENYAVLSQACASAASPQLRRMSSIAGNLLQMTRCWYFRGPFTCWMKGGEKCYARVGENQNHSIFMNAEHESTCVSAHPSDPGAALLALDAAVRYVGPGGVQEQPLEEFFALPTNERRKYTSLPEGHIVTAIVLPPPPTRSVYREAGSRSAWSFPLAGLALALWEDAGLIGRARLALTGVAPIPFRAHRVEEAMAGRAVNDLPVERLADMLASQAHPLEKNGYKVDLVIGLFQEAVRSLGQTGEDKKSDGVAS